MLPFRAMNPCGVETKQPSLDEPSKTKLCNVSSRRHLNESLAQPCRTSRLIPGIFFFALENLSTACRKILGKATSPGLYRHGLTRFVHP